MKRWVDSAHLGDPHSLLLMGTIFTINLFFFFFNLTKNATQQNKSLYVSYVVMLVSSYQPPSAQITLWRATIKRPFCILHINKEHQAHAAGFYWAP